MADEDITLDGKPLSSLRVADLKAALEQRNLPKSGQKNTLIKRLKGALMLENLQRSSSSHSVLQPNSQIGEEMCQNSFIKQYLAKQQELLRQRLEREAQREDENDESPAGAEEDEDHSEDNDSSSNVADKQHQPLSSQPSSGSGSTFHHHESPEAPGVRMQQASFQHGHKEPAASSPPRAVAYLSVRVLGQPDCPPAAPRSQEKEHAALSEPGSAHPVLNLSRSARSSAGNHVQDDSDDDDDDDSDDSDDDEDWGPGSGRAGGQKRVPPPMPQMAPSVSSAAARSKRKLQPPQHIPPPPQVDPIPMQLRHPTPPPSPPHNLFPLPDTPKQSPPDDQERDGLRDPQVVSFQSSSRQRQDSDSSSGSSSPEPPVRRRPGPLSLLVHKMETEEASSAPSMSGETANSPAGCSREPLLQGSDLKRSQKSREIEDNRHMKEEKEREHQQELERERRNVQEQEREKKRFEEEKKKTQLEEEKKRRQEEEQEKARKRQEEEEKEKKRLEEEKKKTQLEEERKLRQEKERKRQEEEEKEKKRKEEEKKKAQLEEERKQRQEQERERKRLEEEKKEKKRKEEEKRREEERLEKEKKQKKAEQDRMVVDETRDSGSSSDSDSKSDSSRSSHSSSSSSSSFSRDKIQTVSQLKKAGQRQEAEGEKKTDVGKVSEKPNLSKREVSEPSTAAVTEVEPDSESSMAQQPAAGSEPESSESRPEESTTPKAFAARRISLTSSKASPASTDGAAGDPETGNAGGRKRRWGSSTAVTVKKPSISITTDSLKSLIPDIKVNQEAVVDLHPEELQLSGDEENLDPGRSDPDKGLKIRRTVTQVVPNDNQENGQANEDEDVEKMETENQQKTPRDKLKCSLSDEASEPQISVELDGDVKKVTPSDNLVRRSISQQKSGVSVTIDDPVRTTRQPSPPRGKVSNIIHVTNLVRPFTLLQLKELLNRTGSVVEDGFWIDKIKSHCYVTYSTEEEAISTRTALHGVKWPASNPKVLSVDFCEQDELDFHKGILKPKKEEDHEVQPIIPPNRLPPLMPERDREKDHDRDRDKERERDRGDREREWDRGVRDLWAERRREMERRERARGEREWDRDKVREFARPGEDGRRSRSRDREKRRRERAKSKEKKADKKDKGDEPPAKLLDDLFLKTKAAPCIYWLPLTEEQATQRLSERLERQKERERRREEEDKKREEEKKERLKVREKDNNTAASGAATGRAVDGDRERDRGRDREGDKRKDTSHRSKRPSPGAGPGRRSRSRSNPRDRRR